MRYVWVLTMNENMDITLEIRSELYYFYNMYCWISVAHWLNEGEIKVIHLQWRIVKQMGWERRRETAARGTVGVVLESKSNTDWATRRTWQRFEAQKPESTSCPHQHSKFQSIKTGLPPSLLPFNSEQNSGLLRLTCLAHVRDVIQST